MASGNGLAESTGHRIIIWNFYNLISLSVLFLICSRSIALFVHLLAFIHRRTESVIFKMMQQYMRELEQVIIIHS